MGGDGTVQIKTIFKSKRFSIIYHFSFIFVHACDTQCLNEDGVTVSLSVSMQYKIRPSNIRDIVMQFKDQNGYVNMITKIGKLLNHYEHISSRE